MANETPTPEKEKQEIEASATASTQPADETPDSSDKGKTGPETAETHQGAVEATRGKIQETVELEKTLEMIVDASKGFFLSRGLLPLILSPENREKPWAQKAITRLVNDGYQLHILSALSKSKDEHSYEKIFQQAFEKPFKESALVIKEFWVWLKDKTWLEPFLIRYFETDLYREGQNADKDSVVFLFQDNPTLAPAVFGALSKSKPEIFLKNYHLVRNHPWAEPLTDEIPDAYLKQGLNRFNVNTFLKDEIVQSPKLLLRVAKLSPAFFLKYGETSVDPSWAEPAFREAARQEPKQALLSSSAFWEKAWGPSIVEEALTHVKLIDFEPKALEKMPWYPRLGLRLLDK
jgi:hypothetical protein